MRLRGAILLLAVAAATPEVRYFRYTRPLAAPAARAGQTCVALDAGVFAHAAAGLDDVRLYRGTGPDQVETPYAIREVSPIEPKQKEIAPLNLGHRGPHTTFEAVMPEGRYSDVDLDLTARNFIATVAVTGAQTESGREGTELGLYTIFDLSSQKLGRSTVLHLPQSDFRYLYFSIDGPLKPAEIEGLSVERLPAKQQYITVASTDQITQKGRESVVTFKVPGHVPVERIEFLAGANPPNFSRDAVVKVQELMNRQQTDTEPPAPVETSGTLLRLHTTRDGHRIDEEHLAIDAPWTGSAAAGSTWMITVDNGDDAPLDIQEVRLEMAERQLCFDAAASGASYTLDYGDAALARPQYDYARLFAPEPSAALATLGPEAANPQYEKRPDARPFTERHPALLWVALIAVILVLGGVAVRTAKQSGPKTP